MTDREAWARIVQEQRRIDGGWEREEVGTDSRVSHDMADFPEELRVREWPK